MSKYETIKPIFATFAVSMSMLAAPAGRADQNPFSATEVERGYMLTENQTGETGPGHPESRNSKPDKSGAMKVSDEKIKEGTCAAEHRKAMEGMCGGMAGNKTNQPHE